MNQCVSLIHREIHSCILGIIDIKDYFAKEKWTFFLCELLFSKMSVGDIVSLGHFLSGMLKHVIYKTGSSLNNILYCTSKKCSEISLISDVCLNLLYIYIYIYIYI